MGEHARMVIRLGKVLEQLARPYGCEEALPAEIRAALWQLGFPCSEMTPREELIPRLWARKRSLLAGIGSEWGGPGLTPPSAA
jgi:hypothetical protein